MITLREATATDADLVGQLHATSWRIAYRGILGDAYIDHEIGPERRKFWRARFADPPPGQSLIIAEREGAAIGFVCLLLDFDQEFGAEIDALHVMPGHKGMGLGKRLLAAAARLVVDRRPGQKLHLWVYGANRDARAFYDARRGRPADTMMFRGVDGTEAPTIRYVWDDPRTLLI